MKAAEMTDKGFGEIRVGKVDKKQCRKIFQKKFAKNLENKKTCLTFAPLSALKKRRGLIRSMAGNKRPETAGWRREVGDNGRLKTEGLKV